MVGQLRGERLALPHARAMPTVGRRCIELRVRDEDANWRIMLRVDEDAVVVVEVFEKKTRKTPKRVIEAAKARLKRYDEVAGGQPMAMRRTKKERLEASGWRVGTTAEFLGVTKEEAALIEMKLGLAENLRKRRRARRLIQTQLARRLGSSQSRVAKMEAADPSVSIDLLGRALLKLGPSRSQVARAVTRRSRRAA